MNTSPRPPRGAGLAWDGPARRPDSQAALRRRNHPQRTRIQGQPHAQRAAERLEDRLGLMVRVVALQVVDVQRDARVVRETLEELERELGVEGADHAGLEVDAPEQ